MATVNAGKHHSGQCDTTAGCGKHRAGRAGGLSVATLLERVSQAGQAIRLAWRGGEHNGLAPEGNEFPTAVLPMVRDRILGPTLTTQKGAPCNP